VSPWLRRAGPGDAPAVAALERAASLHPWSEAQVREELARPAPDAVLVLDGSDGIMAYCAARVVLDELQVMNLAVDARLRRRGLGRFLLRRCLALGERAGVRRALLEVRAGNTAARALYADCGFVLLGHRKAYYAEPVEDALVLVRDAPAVRP
jgi:[ribosomal protein S18]-alanine N-acetyltransferase